MNSRVCWSFALIGMLAWPLQAGVKAEEPGGARNEVGAEAVEATAREHLVRSIRELGSDDYALRRDARERLVGAGADAVELLQEKASGEALPVARECIRILRQLMLQEGAGSEAAKKALGELADSSNAQVAQAAKDALFEGKQPPIAPGAGLRIIVNGNVIAPGRRFRDLRRHIDVEEDGRKIRISDPAGGPITVRVTEVIDGEEKVTESKAGNAAELHRNDPDAFELYRKHVLMKRLPAQAAAGGMRVTVSSRVVNGKRTINAQENDRKIMIEDEQGKNIRISVTETVDGDEETRTVEAKDVDDLRRQDEGLARDYEKFTAGQPINVRWENRWPQGLPRPPVVGGPGLQPIRPGGVDRAANRSNEAIEAALEKLDAIDKTLKRIMETEPEKSEEIETLREQLSDVEKDLFAAQASLGQ